MSEMKVEINEETLKRFEALPRGGNGRPGHQWTPEEDELLRRYWPIKRKTEVARLLGMNENTARKRYREMVERGEWEPDTE